MNSTAIPEPPPLSTADQVYAEASVRAKQANIVACVLIAAATVVNLFAWVFPLQWLIRILPEGLKQAGRVVHDLAGLSERTREIAAATQGGGLLVLALLAYVLTGCVLAQLLKESSKLLFFVQTRAPSAVLPAGAATGLGELSLLSVPVARAFDDRSQLRARLVAGGKYEIAFRFLPTVGWVLLPGIVFVGWIVLALIAGPTGNT